MTPGKVKEHFGQQMGSLLSPEYWCNSQFVAKFMVQIWVAINLAQEYNINGQFLWPVYLPKVWLCHIISAQLHVIEAQERHEKSPKKGQGCWFSLWLLISSYLMTKVVTVIVLLTHILAVCPTTHWSMIIFVFPDDRICLDVHFTIWEISKIKADIFSTLHITWWNWHFKANDSKSKYL